MSATESTPKDSMLYINIVEQIEYYFGDFNMMRDKFLKQEITKDDGWVPVSTLLRFNRLASLTKDVKCVMKAFSENPSTVVEVNTERECIRRKVDIPIPEHDENWRTSVAERTIYVKGFPPETTTLDDVLKFMQTFGKIDNVFKRSYFDKALKEWKFKGSVFVAFPTAEDAEKFISIKSVKYAGTELLRKWQNDYVEEKKNERLESKLKAKESKNQLLKEQQEEIKKDWKKLPTGALVSLSGLESSISLHELKKTLIDLKWDVAFIDYAMGATTACIRLQEENTAKDVLSKLVDNSLELKGITLKGELVEGEKETELLEKMEADKSSRLMQNFSKIKGKKGKGKKNFKNGRPERGSNSKADSNSKGDAMELVNETPEQSNGSEKSETASQSNDLKRKGEESSTEEPKKSKPEEK